MLLGQLEAPRISSETLTVENVIKWLVIPWLIVSALSTLGVMEKVPWSEAFAPFPEERRRRKRRR